MDISASVRCLKGVGDSLEALLSKLDIYSVGDLISFFPRDYDEIPPVTDAGSVISGTDAGEKVILRLSVRDEPRVRYIKKYRILSCIGGDGSGELRLQWFNMPWLKNVIKKGGVYYFRGTVSRNGSHPGLTNPKVLSPGEYEELKGRLIPVYPLTKGLSAGRLTGLIKQALEGTAYIPDPLEDELESGFLKGSGLISLRDAYHGIHFAKDRDELIKARRRLSFDEFLIFILQLRALTDTERPDNTCPCADTSLARRVMSSLPYELTGAQKRCIDEIFSDISGSHMMNRLVQGDVGSGKTIVAFLAMLCAAGSGYQSALMAPTEVLARQHYIQLRDMLEKNGIDDLECIYLAGSMTEKEKRDARQRLADGSAMIAVGTHALIQDSVSFKNPGLVVTDEQHRFGVRQRMRLSGGDVQRVHTLVMSATPIPRTLAIILYGDLDISLIDELPASRLPIKNCVVGPAYRNKAYEFITKQVQEGRQALVICSMVEDSESIDAENVTDYTDTLREALPDGIRIELLHGRMKGSEKNEIMERFASGECDVLVSTTVVEVGVNVPNTTVMMVENAERFGLSQLHQLRGRVGRGSHQSYCIFMCTTESKKSKERLDILNRSNDGFKIAEEDLRQRGPGDFFGLRQSGAAAFRIGDIYTDAPVLKLASDYAGYITGGGGIMPDGLERILSRSGSGRVTKENIGL